MAGITIPNQGLSTTLSYSEFNQLLEALKDGTRDVRTYGLTVNGTLAATTPVFVTPSLGTPTILVGTNITGAATALTSGYATNVVGGAGGGIVYQTATSASAVLTNGTAGQVLTSAGTTLAPTWTTVGQEWNLIETLTYSGVATKSTSVSFASYSWLRFVWSLRRSTGTGTTTVEIQFNGVTTNYSDIGLLNLVNTAGTSRSSARIGSVYDQQMNAGELIVKKDNDAADRSAWAPCQGSPGTVTAGSWCPLAIGWYLGVAATGITSATIITGANVTGTVWVYGKI